MSQRQFLIHQIAEALRFYNEDKNDFHLDVIKNAKHQLETLGMK